MRSQMLAAVLRCFLSRPWRVLAFLWVVFWLLLAAYAPLKAAIRPANPWAAELYLLQQGYVEPRWDGPDSPEVWASVQEYKKDPRKCHFIWDCWEWAALAIKGFLVGVPVLALLSVTFVVLFRAGPYDRGPAIPGDSSGAE